MFHFSALLNFFSVASWTFYLLTVLGLLVLRVKEPHLDRPYRAWLVTPIVFCAVSMFLLLMPIFAAPWEAFAAFGKFMRTDRTRDAETAALVFIASGMPVYYLTVRSRTRNAELDGASSSGWGVRVTLSGELFDQYIKQQTLTTGRCVDQIQRRYR